MVVGHMPSFFNCGGSSTGSSHRLPPADAERQAEQLLRTPSFGVQRGVQSFMDGIMSPFAACVAPCGEEATTTPWEDNQQRPLSSGVSGPGKTTAATNAPQASSPPQAQQQQQQHLHQHQQHQQQQQQQPEELVANIEHPHCFDVLLGRGGSSTRHEGNLNFRRLIAANKAGYSRLTKKQKMMLARQIVDIVRNTDPPGRFLARDVKTGYFYDVGLSRSCEKASQTLREKSIAERAAATLETLPSMEVPGLCSSSRNNNNNIHHATSSSATAKTTTTTQGRSSSKKVEAPTVVIPPSLASTYRLPLVRVVSPSAHGSTTASSTCSSLSDFNNSSSRPLSARHQQKQPYPRNFSPYVNMQTPVLESPPLLSHSYHHNASASVGTAALSSLPPPRYNHLFKPGARQQHHTPYRPEPSRLAPTPTLATMTSNSPSSPTLPYHHHHSAFSSPQQHQQHEWKRQRISSALSRSTYDLPATTSDGHGAAAVSSSSSLSQAMQSRLTLEERVVGSPRANANTTTLSSQPPPPAVALVSPSSVTQSRLHSRLDYYYPRSYSDFHYYADDLDQEDDNGTGMDDDDNNDRDMDGLAALSAAAYLKLDDSL